MAARRGRISRFLLVVGAALGVMGVLQLGSAALGSASASSTSVLLGVVAIVAGVVDIAYALLKKD